MLSTQHREQVVCTVPEAAMWSSVSVSLSASWGCSGEEA